MGAAHPAGPLPRVTAASSGGAACRPLPLGSAPCPVSTCVSEDVDLWPDQDVRPVSAGHCICGAEGGISRSGEQVPALLRSPSPVIELGAGAGSDSDGWRKGSFVVVTGYLSLFFKRLDAEVRTWRGSATWEEQSLIVVTPPPPSLAPNVLQRRPEGKGHALGGFMSQIHQLLREISFLKMPFIWRNGDRILLSNVLGLKATLIACMATPWGRLVPGPTGRAYPLWQALPGASSTWGRGLRRAAGRPYETAFRVSTTTGQSFDPFSESHSRNRDR